MLKTLRTLLVPIQDNNGEFSGKRILGATCVIVGIVLTIEVTRAAIRKEGVPIAELTLLIAPLFGTGITFWGITAYYQKKDDRDNNTSTNSTGSADNS